MIVVTGGAGFIGSNLVKALNERGETDILVVDDLSNGEQALNLSDLRIADYMNKREFIKALRGSRSRGKVKVLFHQGACTDTTATDAEYMIENNFTFSKDLYNFCARERVQFIYASSASVYGGFHNLRPFPRKKFIEDPQHESALNVYAQSKLLFDRFVRYQPTADFQCVGLRYFNVYGPREQHKGQMASVVWHFFNQYQRDRKIKLFKGSHGFGDGEQQRDFVSVGDVVKVNLFFLDNPSISGIYNVGTGCRVNFNAVAMAVISACRHHRGDPDVLSDNPMENGEIEYIPMPDELRDKYQSYTEADLTKLRAAGYDEEFLDISSGVEQYVGELLRAPAGC